MITPESRKLLSELTHTNYGKALREFLDERCNEIGDISKCKTWEETQGRKFALDLIKDLFVFMDKKDVVDNGKNSYT